MIIEFQTEPHTTPVGDIIGIKIEEIRIQNLESVLLMYSLVVDATKTDDGIDLWDRRTQYDWSTFVSFVQATENDQTREFMTQLIEQELGLTVKDPEPFPPEEPEEPEELEPN